MVTVCVPVLKRYDLLANLVASVPAEIPVLVLDNGKQKDKLDWVRVSAGRGFDVYTPDAPMGVAASWNWLIAFTDDGRLIANDDIEFAPESIEAMASNPADFVSCGFGFSCFLIRNTCLERVGLFDETLSPGYGYFEDVDYYHRMHLAKIQDAVVQCGVIHRKSQTLAVLNEEELKAHHQRFDLACKNTIAKWGQHVVDAWRARSHD